MEFLIQLIGTLLLGVFVLLTSAGFFLGTSAAFTERQPWIINILLWVVFLVWQLGPVLFEGYSPGLSFREIARYPVSFPVSSSLNCLYGLTDPVAVTCLFWLSAMWMAIMTQRPAWALLAALLFLMFIVFNVLCNRIVIGLLERFQSTRRGRELMVVVFLVLMLLPQAIQFMARDLGRTVRSVPLKPLLGAVLPVNRISPPGVLFEALTLNVPDKLLPLALMLVYTAIALLLLVRQSRRIYQGEIYAEGHAARRELKVAPGWRLPGVDLTISAIFEKEIRYLRQNMRLLVQLAYPAIFLVFIFFGRGAGKQVFSITHSASGLITTFGGILLMGVPNLAYNIFGLDNEGFGRWLLSPLPLRKVIFAKNLAHGLIFAAMYLLVSIVACTALPVAWTSVITTTIAFFAILVLQFAVGNVCSAQWPKKVDLTKMNSRMASNAAAYTSLLVTLPIAIICALVVAGSMFLDLEWLPLAASIAGVAIALAVYNLLLNRTVNHVYDHLEDIERILGS